MLDVTANTRALISVEMLSLMLKTKVLQSASCILNFSNEYYVMNYNTQLTVTS